MTRRLLRTFAVGLLAAAGCSQPAPPPPIDDPKPELPAAVVVAPKEEPKPAEPPKVEPFRFRDDAAGRKVEQVLTPSLPAEKLPRVTAPRPRTSEVERGELPTKRPTATAAPLPPPARKPAMPTPPREGIPATLGVGGEPPLHEVKLPDGAGVKAPPRPEPTAADVPRMATQQPDRVPTDDPTAEISTLRIVNTLMLAPAMSVPFLKLVLPDPFEFAEQIKPRAVPELATTPAFVPPAKP